ncbi:hypothetical protein pb186bvf_005207 [Paramecium bursaria]
MIYIIFSFLLVFCLYRILYPLIVGLKLKIQLGNKVEIQYIPLLGMIHYFQKGLNQFDDIIYFRKNGLYKNPEQQVIATNLMLTPVFIFTDPLLAKEIYQNVDNYKKFGNQLFNNLLGNKGIVFSEEEVWRLQRKQMGDLFTYSKLIDLIPYVKEQVKQVMQFNKGERVKLVQESSKVTSKVILKTFFNKNDSTIINGKEEVDELIELGVEIFKITYTSLWHYIRGSFGITPNSDMPKFLMSSMEKSILQRIYQYRTHIKKMIEQRIVSFNEEDKDVISQMLKGKKITEDLKEEILHQYLTFVFAGTHTTSNFAALSTYYLAKYPQIQLRLREELQNIDYDQIDGETITKLPLLNAFVNECLRFGSPSDGLIPRVAAKDHYVGQIFVKKGTMVDIGLIPITTHPKYFENSQEFDIDRWMKTKSNDGFIPFSGGRRNCIGQHLALIETKLILIYLIQNYNITIDDQTKLVMHYGFAYEPVDDRLVKFERLIK